MSQLPPPMTPAQADAQLAQLLGVAVLLRQEGRVGHALPILEHIATLHPGRTDLRLLLVEMLAETGRNLDAMAQLNALKARGVTQELLTAIQAQAEAGIHRFNAHLSRNEVAEAERYAAALAELLPQNLAMLRTAMACNQTLGRAEPARRYAEAIVALEPLDREARTLAADHAHAAGDLASEIEHRFTLALSPAPESHALLRLRDLHDAAGLILCRPLTPRSRQQLDQLLAAARALEVQTEPGELAAWECHYRVLMDALDMDLALKPPAKRPAGKVEMMSASGERLDWKSLKARADKLGAECVFFAAADEAYVDLYARWYALSVRRYADAPYLTVIHVIGGQGALDRIAAKVGVDDERLVFMACDFDPAEATVKIYDAPPKVWTEKPVAHLQSVRFLRLGALLDRLQRPVFVSDIDLLLQRGVADLLAAHAHEDVVLNENELTFNPGSRITANLLMANPTANARTFIDAVAGYLENRLSGAEVTRWIDQVALTLGRHNLQANAPGARIGYFDTRSDINNVMYPSYQEHPFRFLSLFHGFDTSSLERDPRVLGEGAPQPSAA
ncbi:tetratricopeptide repeat protein [Phenylobacterium soli]|uniref:Uncharacterized protein n=1 Tax=Phenylobacterium soli TaxID=2170551 RepID=A0A328AMZ6_9CAUL|nr:tetratricopeptide repeat protein [Phenylobacterium soli]RAK54794.1 hypothetical protein DJ017_09780 [Phenylobacterium soli]